MEAKSNNRKRLGANSRSDCVEDGRSERPLLEKASRAVQFLLLFCITMLFLLCIGNLQHFQDTSLTMVLVVEAFSSAANVVLSVLLLISSIISAIRDTQHHTFGLPCGSRAGGRHTFGLPCGSQASRRHHIKAIVLGAAASVLSAAFLLISLSILLLSYFF